MEIHLLCIFLILAQLTSYNYVAKNYYHVLCLIVYVAKHSTWYLESCTCGLNRIQHSYMTSIGLMCLFSTENWITIKYIIHVPVILNKLRKPDSFGNYTRPPLEVNSIFNTIWRQCIYFTSKDKPTSLDVYWLHHQYKIRAYVLLGHYVILQTLKSISWKLSTKLVSILNILQR